MKGGKLSMIGCVLLLAATSWAGTDGDWPRWRGPALEGSTATNDDLPLGKQGYGLKVAWQNEIGSSYSSVSIAGNHAVTFASDGTSDYMVSLNAETGKEQWRYRIGKAYIGHNGSHDGPNSTPTIDGNTVYGLGANGNLFALALDTGRPLWNVHIIEKYKSVIPNHGFTTVPLVVDDKLIVMTGGENSAFSAFNKTNGNLVWAMGNDNIDYQSPIVAEIEGKTQVIAAGRQKLYSINPADGHVYWEHEFNIQGGTYNPLYVGKNKIYLSSLGRESVMLQVKDNKVSEAWRTAQMGRSWNAPVLVGNHLYGFTGRFLTCLNAETGELAWKSRPPGDGWLIAVNNYLVIQAKAGTVHVAEANPEEYREITSLKVFEPISWNPPSFAHGKIYVRSVTGMAALNIDRVDQVFVEASGPPSLKIEGTRFAKFVADVEKSDNKAAKIKDFMAKQKSFPVIEDNYAHFVYQGSARDLTLTGDMLETNQEAVMNRIEGTDFFYGSMKIDPKARLNYQYNKDFDNRITDPHNKVVVPTIAGDASQLSMKGYQRAAHLKEPEGPRGTTESFDFKSKILDNDHKVQVHLPASYTQGNKRYPTLYVNYGSRAITMGLMTNTLDNLMGKTIKDVITVFLDSPNAGIEYARAGRDNHAQMIVQELIPHIDAKYRTSAKASDRAIMGGDEGGYAAIYAAFKYPGTFSKVAGQSTHMLNGNGGEEIWALLRASDKQDLQFYLDWGAYDYRQTQGNFNWGQLNVELKEWLVKQGYTVSGGEFPTGWGWASWRERTDKPLEDFFSLKLN